MACTHLQAKDHGPRLRFSVKSGPAEDTLTEMALQANLLIGFDAEAVRGVRTNSVRGWFTVGEALALMLDGTALVAVPDALGASFAIRVREVEGLVKLPPYIVEDDKGTPWLYAQLDDIEVLSRCSPDLTANLIDRHRRLLTMLDLIYPAKFWPQRDVPTLLVLNEAQLQTQATRELTEAIQRRITTDSIATQILFMPNFHFYDADSQVIYFLLEGVGIDRSAVTVTPAYLRYMLESRIPALPRWFIEGMVTLQETVVLPVPPVELNPISMAAVTTMKPTYPYDIATVRSFVWINSASTKQMHDAVKLIAKTTGRAHLPASVSFLSFKRLLAVPGDATLDAKQRAIFASQAALFIRWLLDPAPRELIADGQVTRSDKPDATALWRFLERCEREPVTETLFKECFGLPFTEVERRLRAYLPFACLDSSSFELKPAASSTSAKPDIRRATPLEVSRLKGRLDRLSIGYVRSFYPDLFPQYTRQARRTLRHAYRMGERDGQLLAELGLCEVDAGNDAAATPLLNESVQQNVRHPRVYFELARIEFMRLREAHPDLMQVDAEMEHITDLLTTSLGQTPEIPQAYELLFEVWMRRGLRLAAGQKELLERGARLFPGYYRIAYAAALLQVEQGDIKAAQAIIDRSLPLIQGEMELNRFKQLKDTLEQ